MISISHSIATWHVHLSRQQKGTVTIWRVFSRFGPCSSSVELALCDRCETYSISSCGEWWWLVLFLMCSWGFAVQKLKQINSNAWKQMWTFPCVNYFPEENISPSCSCRLEWWWRISLISYKKIQLVDREGFAGINPECTILRWQKISWAVAS